MLRARDLKPRLFPDADGNLFIEISVKGLKLQRAIPSMETPGEAEEYINKTVTDMAKELYRKIRNRRKAERKK